MVAVDTNVLVRLLVKDHPAQTARAAAIFAESAIYIPKTVLLEAAWVLGDAYGLDNAEVARLLRSVAGLSNVVMEDPQVILEAFVALESGVDFADALHVASSAGAERFVTFDRRLGRKAATIRGVEVKLL